MSYCRFQNTKNDLAECVGVLEEIYDEECVNLSTEEVWAAHKMYELCKKYIELYEEVGEQLQK